MWLAKWPLYPSTYRLPPLHLNTYVWKAFLEKPLELAEGSKEEQKMSDVCVFPVDYRRFRLTHGLSRLVDIRQLIIIIIIIIIIIFGKLIAFSETLELSANVMTLAPLYYAEVFRLIQDNSISFVKNNMLVGKDVFHFVFLNDIW